MNEIIPDQVYGYEEDTMEGVVGNLLLLPKTQVFRQRKAVQEELWQK